MTMNDSAGTGENAEARQRRLNLLEARRLTAELRSSSAPKWREVRERLAREEITPDDAAVGIMFPDDTNVEFGVIGTRGGRVFTFTFEILPLSAGSGEREGRLWQWEEKTDDVYRGDALLAATVLNDDAGPKDDSRAF